MEKSVKKMSNEWEYIDIFEGTMNLLALPFFIIAFVFVFLIYLNKKTASRAILALLLFGGCLFSFGEIIETFVSFEHYPQLDELGDSYNIFIASILLILGFIVILEQKLKISEQRFQYLFENSPYSVFLLELNSEILECNHATEIILKTKRANLIGKFFTHLFPDHSKLSKILEERIGFMEKGKILKPLEIQLQTKNDSLFWVSLQTSLLNLDNELFILVILQDITERKKAEKIIKEEMNRLKDIDQIRSDLIRRTSHELKTPLISIYSSTQFLLENYQKEMNDEMLNLIELINRGGKRLKDLAENLLDVLNLETNAIILHKEKIDLVEIMKNCVKDFSLLLKKRNITIKLEIGDSSLIQADKGRIEQVILNLLSNAIKNTPPNGIIYIGLDEQNDFIDITFRDTGIGFTEDEKENIFEKFGKLERKNIEDDIIIEGSGLGLYITKHLVELHGGKIWMESEGRKKGSTFIIRLPFNEEE